MTLSWHRREWALWSSLFLLAVTLRSLSADDHPAAFRGITPAQTTLTEVSSILGEPKRRTDSDIVRWTYEDIGPFETVDIFAQKDVVTSIVAKLKERESVDALVEQLNLGKFVPVEILEDKAPLGLVFPERGVLFTYAESKSPRDKERKIDRIAIEPLTGEPFWLRAKFADPSQLGSILRDLESAQRYGWTRDDVVVLQAHSLARARRYEQALQKLDSLPRNIIGHRESLLHAGLLAQAGQRDDAIRILKRLVSESSDDSLIQAEATLRYGELLSQGLDRNMGEAVKKQTNAMKMAKKLTRERDTQRRRTARRIVLEAYLALADSIARGPFRDQNDAVEEWCTAAWKALESQPFLRDDPITRFTVARRILAAKCRASKPLPLNESVLVLDEAVQRIDRVYDDPVLLAVLHWQEATVRMLAARAAVKQGHRTTARRQASRAAALIAAIAVPEDDLARRMLAYDRGCIEFQRGSVAAVFDQDHEAAIVHYAKALAQFETQRPPLADDELGIHGERFVSMGVSYWQTGKKQRAVELTKRGVALMERAVAHQLLDPSSLTVPYGNLSTMQRERGKEEESEEYARKAAALEEDDSLRR